MFFLSAVAIRACFAVTLPIGLGTAFNFPCVLKQFYSLLFAQHLHDIHSDKSHRWQTMLKVLECDIEWDNPPLSQRMDRWERRSVDRQIVSVQKDRKKRFSVSRHCKETVL